MTPAGKRLLQMVDALNARPFPLATEADILAIEAEAVAAERARIRETLLGFDMGISTDAHRLTRRDDGLVYCVCEMFGIHDNGSDAGEAWRQHLIAVARVAVLAAIDGGDV